MVFKSKDDTQRRMNGGIERINKDSYRIRITVGYNDKGNAIRKSKTVKATSKKQAEKKLFELMDHIEKYGYVDPEKITLKNFVYEHWLTKWVPEKLEKNTKKLYVHFLEVRFFPVLGNTRIDKIKTIDIVDLMHNLKRLDGKEGGLSKSTKKNILLALRNVFDAAVEWNFIKENPASKTSFGKDERETQTAYLPYDSKEIAVIFEKLKLEPLEMQVMIGTALITGAREGEIAALEEKHVDIFKNEMTFEQTIIDVPKIGVELQAYTKTKKVKTVSIPPDFMVLVRIHMNEKKNDRRVLDIKNKWSTHKFLFSNSDGKPRRTSSILQRWSRFTKRYNIRYVRFHDLRHTSATFLLSQGTEPKVIQERLGHSRLSTTMDIYAHVLKEVDQKAADKFTGFV